MPEPTVYKGVYGGSSRRPKHHRATTDGSVMQLLSFVVALAVAAYGVLWLVLAVDDVLSWGLDIRALVFYGVSVLVSFGAAALVAAPTVLYRKVVVRWAALLCAGLFVFTADSAIFLAWLWELDEGMFRIGIPWWIATPIVVMALSTAAVLVCKTMKGRKLG